ncbi:MAG: ureidoglycolate lyase [Oscillatoria sp. PMC 1068.18]|nr:ureidoglycolate lyase [Oscillatoria sp. PMC 1076.18]MEC4989169.1 ureidoglycolate lyase [Oscillatoria sp. PMC 1068.18]
MNQEITIKKLPAKLITLENFQPFGQLIIPTEDGKQFDQTDAQLNLKNGTPRFYLMQLKNKGRQFSQITRHNQCTQCLGSLEGKEWLIAVAPPTSQEIPEMNQIVALKIPGNCFIKLKTGTWHAGPYFDEDFVNFYNLELSDTNLVDHFTYDFRKSHHLVWEIV